MAGERHDLRPQHIQAVHRPDVGWGVQRQHELVGQRGGEAVHASVVGGLRQVLGDDDVGLPHDQHDLEADGDGRAAGAVRERVGGVGVERGLAAGDPHQRERDVVEHGAVGGVHGEGLVVAGLGRRRLVEGEHPGRGVGVAWDENHGELRMVCCRARPPCRPDRLHLTGRVRVQAAVLITRGGEHIRHRSALVGLDGPVGLRGGPPCPRQAAEHHEHQGGGDSTSHRTPARAGPQLGEAGARQPEENVQRPEDGQEGRGHEYELRGPGSDVPAGERIPDEAAPALQGDPGGRKNARQREHHHQQ